MKKMANINVLEEKLFGHIAPEFTEEGYKNFFHIHLYLAMRNIELGSKANRLIKKVGEKHALIDVVLEDGESEKDFFIRHLYSYLGDVYIEEYLSNHKFLILKKLDLWFGDAFKKQNFLAEELSVRNTSNEERLRLKLKSNFTKLDILKSLNNATIDYNPSKKEICLIPYSREGLVEICEKVDYSILREVDKISNVDGKNYKRQGMKFFPDDSVYFLIYKSDDEDYIIITRPENNVLRQQIYFDINKLGVDIHQLETKEINSLGYKQ